MKLFFTPRRSGPLDQLTSFSAVGENATHGSCHSTHTEPDSALSRPPRSPLHLVPGADEEASRRWQAVRPLHLPEVHLPAHHQTWSETTQPRTLARSVWFIWFVLFIWLIWFIDQFRSTKQRDKPEEPNKQDRLPAGKTCLHVIVENMGQSLPVLRTDRGDLRSELRGTHVDDLQATA